MDSGRLIPKGFHFSSQSSHDPPFYQEILCHAIHSTMAPMDYFFIDFGLSRSFPSYEKRHLVGNGGQNKTVPELSAKYYMTQSEGKSLLG